MNVICNSLKPCLAKSTTSLCFVLCASQEVPLHVNWTKASNSSSLHPEKISFRVPTWLICGACWSSDPLVCVLNKGRNSCLWHLFHILLSSLPIMLWPTKKANDLTYFFLAIEISDNMKNENYTCNSLWVGNPKCQHIKTKMVRYKKNK
jgi:hypothetical protein